MQVSDAQSRAASNSSWRSMMTCSRISSRLPLLYSLRPPRSLWTLATYVELLFRNSTLHRGSSIYVHLLGPQAPPQALGCTAALYVLYYFKLSYSGTGQMHGARYSVFALSEGSRCCAVISSPLRLAFLPTGLSIGLVLLALT